VVLYVIGDLRLWWRHSVDDTFHEIDRPLADGLSADGLEEFARAHDHW
jgi:hypothetical protein